MVDLCQGLTGGNDSGYHVFPNFCCVFVLLLIVHSWLVMTFVVPVSLCFFFYLFLLGHFN